ncbi:TRAP transporter small permease [Arsenicitalea aurantiaca]|uniref:TRAP transporter small permease protein n=1 Tax=Arsenicitalea aurantiaca TaxID=1783274 RepID=A0A433XEJ6_9HYPH|nr:TRAP transporter small permease [Arsenicitalea aurantiaca]RUT32486.1 TRAP transporter small permease [Arsenicitalea aurantiaca]
MIGALKRVAGLVNTATEWAAGLLAMFFTGLLIVSVFSRYVFDISIVTGVEMTRIAFCWSAFLAAAAVVARGGHIRIVVGVSMLPPMGRLVIHRFVCLVIIAFGLTMTWYGYSLTMRMMPTFLPAMQVSQAWLYAALPVSGVLIVLHGLVQLFEPAPDFNPVEEHLS